MMKIAFQVIFVALILLARDASATSPPVIGIFTQPTESSENNLYPSQSYLYMLSSYVKWVEMTGSWVIPLRIDWPLDMLYSLMDQIDGILLPGGGNNLWYPTGSNGTSQSNSTPYYQKVSTLLNYGFEKNIQGIPYTIWCTCLGFETLAMYVANSSLVMNPVKDQVNVNSPVNVTDRNSKMYQNMTDEQINYLAQNNATFYDHVNALYPDSFYAYGMNETFTITALTTNIIGQTFVAAMEHNTYPIFASQFHSEKAIFTLTPNLPVNHEFQMIQISQYYANLIGYYARGCPQTMSYYKLQANYIDGYYPVFPPNQTEYQYVFPMIYLGEFSSAPYTNKHQTKQKF